MIRRLIPSALCIFLSPLLIAQQTAQQGTTSAPQPAPPAPIPLQITLSHDAPILIVSPGDVPFAKIKPGTTIRFVIDRDVIVNGVKVFPASTPIEGVVEKVIHASRFQNRSAQMFIRVGESASGTAANILLRCSNPVDNLDNPFNAAGAQFTVVGILNTFAIVALILMVLVLLSI
ncbi:MAG: hypothetical protein ABSE36_00015 [Terracidiphilus sp.]|jgi:hypothetical protein